VINYNVVVILIYFLFNYPFQRFIFTFLVIPILQGRNFDGHEFYIVSMNADVFVIKKNNDKSFLNIIKNINIKV
jgi:hypothetical protein